MYLNFTEMKKQNMPLWVIGNKITLISTEGDFDMALATTPANTPGPPPHYHQNESELFVVLSGQMQVMIAGQWSTFSAGESVVVPKGVIHTFANKTDQDVHWVTTWSPKGFAQFFREFGFDASQEGAFGQSVSPRVIQSVIENCHKYGMILQPVAEREEVAG
jgi:mannose-6-phosphate isomerase-like protein (cupin superfamily)